jgi:Flp pilus assembly protein CpaB
MESESSISERIIVMLLGLIMIGSIAVLAYQLIAIAPIDATGEPQLQDQPEI